MISFKQYIIKETFLYDAGRTVENNELVFFINPDSGELESIVGNQVRGLITSDGDMIIWTEHLMHHIAEKELLKHGFIKSTENTYVTVYKDRRVFITHDNPNKYNSPSFTLAKEKNKGFTFIK